MISVSEAQSILSKYVPNMTAETVILDKALGRICAVDVHAKVTRPPLDASAMDGYAVRLEDVQQSGARLKVIGEVPAGSIFDGSIGPGEAVRLFTGSPIPKGADHVIIQELTSRKGEWVHIETRSDVPQYIRAAGLDFKIGDTVLPRLTKVGPIDIALAAAANHGDLSVFAKPNISILAAGDELVVPGEADAAGDIVNSNTVSLMTLIRDWDGTPINRGLVKDDPSAIEHMFEQARADDIILPIGGASVGDHDHMRRVFKNMGGEMIFEKVAVKPGKPVWFGLLNGTPVLGLPGNPASALVCAHLFLRGLMGRPALHHIQAQLGADLSRNGPRETYLRAKMSTQNGQLHVRPFTSQDSALLTPFRMANCLLARMPNAEPVKAGELVDVIEIRNGYV